MTEHNSDIIGSAFNASQIAARAATLRDEDEQRNSIRTDRLFAALLTGQWAFAILLASVVSPRAWEGLSSSTHPHVWLAIGLGGLLALPPAALAALRPGSTVTRFAIAFAQMAFGSLLIHLTGGRIETHFHVFGSLAFLAFYRDYRLLVAATAVVTLDHVLRGVFWPQSVYGIVSIQPLRWMEHAAWVVFEDVFLMASCLRGQREMRAIAERHAKLESQNHMERAIAEARDAATRSKSEFLANMSHEIRTPMTAIIGYTDLLLDPETTPGERHTHIHTIRRNGEHLLSVLNDILDLSKIEAGKMTIEKVRCSPSMIMVDVASLMRIRAKEKGLSLEIHYQTTIPETIESDPTRLRQILMNLVGNAIKFTTSGGIRILARCEDPQSGPETLTFEVVDTGIGMSDAHVAQLFQPFAQGDTSTTRRFGGTGLGLAICRRLAHILGGDVLAQSSPGRGSSFRFWVTTGPLDGIQMLDNLSEAGRPEEWTEAPSKASSLGCSVLLAEDGFDNQLLISTHLKRAGASVTIAENGRIAVELALAKKPFEVILMDMQMPEMDGYAATSELRRRGYKGPIIALTAHAMSGDRERCLSAGCTDYLTKPISRAKLVATVAEHARSAGRHDASAVPESGPFHLSFTGRTDRKHAVVSEFANQPEMSELVAWFVPSLHQHAGHLTDALRENDREAIRRIAHQLKGAAGGYGFPSITAVAARLEESARKGEPLGQLVAELSELCRRARARTSSAA